MKQYKIEGNKITKLMEDITGQALEELLQEEIADSDFAYNFIMENYPLLKIGETMEVKEQKETKSEETKSNGFEDFFNNLGKETEPEETKKEEPEEELKIENVDYNNKNLVGNVFAEFLKQGYILEKSLISRGQAVYEVKFINEFGITAKTIKRKSSISIKLLEMIAREMDQSTLGCNGREIENMEIQEIDNKLYVLLDIEEGIELRLCLSKEQRKRSLYF